MHGAEEERSMLGLDHVSPGKRIVAGLDRQFAWGPTCWKWACKEVKLELQKDLKKS